MAILKFKKLLEDLQNDTRQVLTGEIAKATSSGKAGTASMSITAGTAVFSAGATTAGKAASASGAATAGTAIFAAGATTAGLAAKAYFGSSGTGALPGTGAWWGTSGIQG